MAGRLELEKYINLLNLIGMFLVLTSQQYYCVYII